MLKLLTFSASSAAALMLLAVAGPALACPGGYCPNDDSPVVGGYTTHAAGTEPECHKVPGSSTKNDPMGRTECHPVTVYEQDIFGSLLKDGDSYSCPANTAAISMPNGYRANNGKFYEGPATVCAKSDTFGD